MSLRRLSILLSVVGSLACGGASSRRGGEQAAKPPPLHDARLLLPQDLLMVVHIDFETLRRSPHFGTVEGLLRRSISKQSRDEAASSQVLRHAKRVWIGVQAPSPADRSARLENVDVWHGPLLDADLKTILAGMTDGNAKPKLQRAAYRGHDGWQTADLLALQAKKGEVWVVGERKAVQSSIDRRWNRAAKRLDCLGCGASPTLAAISRRIELDEGPLALALDLARLPEQSRSRLLGAMLSRITAPARAIGVRAELTEALHFSITASTAAAAAAADWRRTLQGFVEQMQHHPIVAMLGFSSLSQQIEVQQDAAYVEAKLALDEAETRDFLQKCSSL